MRDERKTELVFVTQNEGKFREASSLMEEHGITIVMAPQNKIEIQSLNIEEVAIYAAIEAYQHIHKPLIVEDTGLFIPALNMFPGALSSFVYKTIGIEGILRLLKEKREREAFFEATIAYFDGKLLKTFSGRVEGVILDRPAGSMGFGFDPIFSPHGYYPKSFGQMSIGEKNSVSHRAKAFTKFVEWYKNSH